MGRDVGHAKIVLDCDVRADSVSPMSRKEIHAAMDRLPYFNSAWNLAQNEAWQAWQDAASAKRPDATSLYRDFVATMAA